MCTATGVYPIGFRQRRRLAIPKVLDHLQVPVLTSYPHWSLARLPAAQHTPKMITSRVSISSLVSARTQPHIMRSLTPIPLPIPIRASVSMAQ